MNDILSEYELTKHEGVLSRIPPLSMQQVGWRRQSVHMQAAGGFPCQLARAARPEACANPDLMQSILFSLAIKHRPDCIHALLATAGQAPPGAWQRVAAAMSPDAKQRELLRQL